MPFAGTINFVGMGSNSYGPLMVRWSASWGTIDSATFAFVDLKTLEELQMTKPAHGQMHSVNRDNNQIFASADGKVFTIAGIGPMRGSGNKLERITGGQRMHHRVSSFIPSPDRNFFVSNGQIFNDKLVPVGKLENQNRSSLIVPSVSGQYYLRLIPDQDRRSSRDNGP